MKLTIECTPEQAQMIVDCLEESFRFRMGQENLFLDRPIWEIWDKKSNIYEVRETATCIAKGLMHTLYDGIEQPKEVNEIADMWRVLRHELYLANGGKPDNYMDVRSDNPIQLSDWPLIKVEVKNDNNRNYKA